MQGSTKYKTTAAEANQRFRHAIINPSGFVEAGSNVCPSNQHDPAGSRKVWRKPYLAMGCDRCGRDASYRSCIQSWAGAHGG